MEASSSGDQSELDPEKQFAGNRDSLKLEETKIHDLGHLSEEQREDLRRLRHYFFIEMGEKIDSIAEDLTNAELLTQDFFCVIHPDNNEGEVTNEEKAERLVDIFVQNKEGTYFEDLKKIIAKYDIPNAEDALKIVEYDELNKDVAQLRVIISDTDIPSLKPYRDVIKDTLGTIDNCLKINYALLHYLQRHSVLNENMVNKILIRPNRPEKIKQLMQFMSELGPESLRVFIDALYATKQDFLAKIIGVEEFT